MVEFCSLLKQPDGLNAGKPIILADFQREICEIFGRDENGDRVVNRVLITIPRKNAKTALSAFFLLYLLVVEPIPHAQHYSIAADRDQAAIIFNYMRNVVLMTPELAGVISVTESRKLLTNVNNGSTFRALSSEGKSKHGLSSRCVLTDEAAQVDGELLSILETSMGAYGKEGLFIIIGTQSPDDNNMMSEWVDYANKVNDGTIDDDSFAGFVFSAPEDADIWDEKTWFDCNPAMQAGFRSIDEMRQVAKRAKELGGVKVAEFQNLYLNQRIDSATPFITKQAWMACSEKPESDAFQMYPVYGGLDLSARGDLTSLVLTCQDDDDHIHVKVFAWTPSELVLQHEKSDKAPYRAWVDQGYIEAVPGNSISYDWMAIRLGEIWSDYPQIQSIQYDRWRIKELEHELDKEGVNLPLTPFGQGYKDMSPATEDLAHAIAERQLRHGSNPVLNWCISNAVADHDAAGNTKLTKDKSFGRIDPAIALVMSVRALRVDREHQGISGSEAGILFV